MAFKNEEVTIDGLTFQIHTLPYSDAQRVLLKAKQLLMLKIADSNSFEEGMSPLSAAVFMELNPDDLEFVVNKLAEKSRVKEAGGQFMDLSKQKEIVFAGSMELMFKWLDKALEVNFGNFLGELKKAASKTKLAEESQSQKLSNG